jgi:hypothetical protein
MSVDWEDDGRKKLIRPTHESLQRSVIKEPKRRLSLHKREELGSDSPEPHYSSLKLSSVLYTTLKLRG